MFTKGPWHVGQGNGTGHIFADAGRMKLLAGGTTLHAIAAVVTGFEDREDAANASLLAAAPELYEALNNLALMCGALIPVDNTFAQSVIAEAWHAINKARGD